MERYTLITGASEGLGLEFARIYAAKGYNLILISRSYEKLSKVKAELTNTNANVKVELLNLDLSVENACEKVQEFVDKKNIFVDRLINNAGIGCFGDFNLYSKELVVDIIDLNIKTLTKLTQIFLKKMVVNKTGEILNVASTAAFSAGPKMSVYYASKAYVLSFTEALHEEYKDKGVKISCLCPGALKTSFQAKSGIEKKDGAEKLLMDAKKVAIQGVHGLENGKAIVIPGYKNKIAVVLNKFIPKSIARKVILNMNKK